VVESPTFPGLLQIIELLGMKALEIPTDPATGISLSALDLALEQWPVKACALVPTYNNPLGFSMEQDRRKELLEILKSHEVPLIEDDLFGDLNHRGARPTACKAHDTDGLVMYCSSVSKSLGGGLRVGWTCPGRYTETVRRRKALQGVSGPALNQMLVAEYLATGRYERHTRQLSGHYARNTERIVKAVRDQFPQGTRVRQPEGGYMLWVALPGPVDSWELYRQVASKQISLMPGILFSATGRYTSHLRLSAAMPWRHEVDMALAQIGEMVDALMPSWNRSEK
jgi:DNA-binding transcriptional MocR family regulator